MTEKQKFIEREAVALEYKSGRDDAPRVTAKGRGELAERILDLARIHNIPIHQDTDLVQLLGQLELEAEIPPMLYRVIAEILSFVYFVNEKWKKEKAA